MATRVLRTVLPGIFLAIPLTVSLGLFPSSGLSQDRPINVKMASLAPANSPWHDALMDMGAQWREVSGGKVNLQIIPSGQGGEEDDVLRRMRLGQFQAGGFTIAGLQNLSPAVVVLAIPLAIETQADLHRVRAAVGPDLEEIFLEKGYVLLHWVDMGWMRFFTPDPDPSPDAIRSYTFMEWGENSLTALWRKAGFRPGARLNIADVTVGLQTGLVDAINTAPLVVYGYQWFARLEYMIDIRWAPLSGATLIDRRSWERIPEELRPELLRIAQETGEKVQASLLQWEEEAIEAMKSHGLKVITPPPEVVEEWRRLFESSTDLLRGDFIPAEMYDEAIRVARDGKGG
jgi:TRAP-type C4-dicarboxylate transport system substrate-binding protein